MALKVLMLRKRIDEKKAALEDLKAVDFAVREAELEGDIEKAQTEEEKAAVEDEIAKFEAEKKENQEKAESLQEEIEALESELAEEERSQDPAPAKREENKVMNNEIRGEFFGMSAEERSRFFERDDVKDYLGEVRTCIREKRALTNVGLTIPQVFLGVLRDNISTYSKVLRHVDLRRISGEGRIVIMGGVPEAVWTECCANINELDLAFYDATVDCHKVAGFYAVCNATAEDSDLDLARELMTALGKSIAKAIDKAGLYGDGVTMPLGVLARLAQTQEPAGYPVTGRPWVDLHTTNIITIPATATKADLFAEILLAAGAASSDYAAGSIVWFMNQKTHTKLKANALTINADGNVVANVGNTMPGIGGTIEELNFITDDVMIAGYFENYLMAERAAAKFAESEHYRFLADQTVFKGTARYDGLPLIAEAFVAIGINGVTPSATMTFAPDVANTTQTTDPEGA